MKHLVFLLLIAGISMSTACSTNETYDESDDDSAMPAATSSAAQTSTEPAIEEDSEPAAKEPEPEAQTQAAPAATSDSSDGSNVTYVCKHDNSVRTIRVIYHSEGPMVCEVTYEKSTGTQSLWNASSDESYCEPKAAEFVAKQEGWGWDCSKQ